VHDDLGDIALDDLTGPVTATANLGDIGGRGLTCTQARLTDNLGDIDVAFVTPPAAVDAIDSDGDISIQVPTWTAYHVTARSQLGSVSVTVPRAGSQAPVSSTHQITATSQLGDVTVSG
jgi:hypothetical protein